MKNKAIALLSDAEKADLIQQASYLMQDFFTVKKDFNDMAHFNKMVKNLLNRPIAKELSNLT